MARIFFVEDNEGLREAATGYLKLDDHEVVEFGRLQGVLEALRVREPDLIILDVMLLLLIHPSLYMMLTASPGEARRPIRSLVRRSTPIATTTRSGP